MIVAWGANWAARAKIVSGRFPRRSTPVATSPSRWALHKGFGRDSGISAACLKELEYLRQRQSGPSHERVERLIDHVLVPLEQEWLGGHREKAVVARVKKLRIAILPDMVHGQITDEERERRWGQLADMRKI
jgi:hypothetical protein